MKILKMFPPNFSEIKRVFPIAGVPNILYAYGDAIYNPSGVPISEWIKAHEQEHMTWQELFGVEEWWKRYISDWQFRLYEEIKAHKVEFQVYRLTHTEKEAAKYLEVLAERLSSPIYGSLVTKNEARLIVRE